MVNIVGVNNVTVIQRIVPNANNVAAGGVMLQSHEFSALALKLLK